MLWMGWRFSQRVFGPCLAQSWKAVDFGWLPLHIGKLSELPHSITTSSALLVLSIYFHDCHLRKLPQFITAFGACLFDPFKTCDTLKSRASNRIQRIKIMVQINFDIFKAIVNSSPNQAMKYIQNILQNPQIFYNMICECV